MKFYTFPASPNAVKVKAVMNEIGLQPSETIEVDLTKGETHNQDFLALNTNAMIPVIVDDDLVLSESNAIILYLAEKHGSKLLPDTLAERAQMHKWLSWQLAHFGPAVGGVVFERLAPQIIPGAELDEAHLERSLALVKRFAPVLEEHLKERKFILGERLSLADVAIASQLIHAELAMVPLSPYPNILAWYREISSFDFFKDARGKLS